MNINHICMSCMTELNEEGICPNCHTDNASNRNDNRHLPVRTILRGKYLVGRVIGEGGFGITYIGYDLDLQIRVAIKEFCPRELAGREITDQMTLLPYNAESEEFFEAEKEKFIDEARRLAKFRSEQGVVSVLDYFKENKTAYIVMEYIEGVTLRRYLNMLNVHMQLDELLVLLKPLMETLEKIHKANIVHRDISPDNIMISGDRKKVYLIDFGTARAFDTEHSMSTYRKGSYTPVEQQSRRGNQGPWTDVYALCATIYYCITGKNIPESVERVMEDDLVPPSKLGVGITPTMEEALLKGLAVRPENRTQSIEKLMEELYGVKGAEKEAVVENKEQDEDVTLPISEEKKDFVIPLDAEGNVDIGALPISDAVKYDAKNLLNQWVEEYKRGGWTALAIIVLEIVILANVIMKFM